MLKQYRATWSDGIVVEGDSSHEPYELFNLLPYTTTRGEYVYVVALERLN